MSAFSSKTSGSTVFLNPGTKKLPFEASATTDTDTEKVLYCTTVPLNTIVLIEYTIRGRKTADIGGGPVAVGEGAVYRRTALFENKDGVLLRKKQTTQMHEEPIGNWSGDSVISGIDVCFVVKGTNNDEINWEIDGIIQQLGAK